MNTMDEETRAARIELNAAMERLHALALKRKGEGPPYCSFCNAAKGQYLCCVRGNNNVHICDWCVIEAYQLVAAEARKELKDGEAGLGPGTAE